KPAANWIGNELNKILNERKLLMADVKTTPLALVELLTLVESGAVTGASAKEIFAEMATTGASPAQLVQSKGLGRVTDRAALEEAARAALAANPKYVADFRSGKEAAFKALLGGVMKQTKGRADPKLAEEILRGLLK
ncbi:MAG TPA: Asp-tRNA(Asn)/Glu-tRNA(Gln) amidotransferase GatCAB subunit B, partial [Planctomycetota bacterium]|nr:Asp-tRNA(Asn)/Glu-tRNA(Gln) amidotransferase GatCAB subunit B [Planctomycetota bacterium]